jgi:hypothetical protein
VCEVKSILDVVVSCITCSWIGTVGDCEPDKGDGELGCPKCGTMIITSDVPSVDTPPAAT